jgi:hypothetical protein
MKLRMVIGLALFAALAARLCLIPLYPEFRFPDERWYTEIAQNLLSGNGYVLAADGHNRFAICKAPALPFTLAAWGLVFPLTPGSVKAVNILLNWGGIVFLTMAASRLACIWRPVLLTALFAGLHPSVLFLGLTNYPQNGQLFFLGLLVWNLARRNRHTVKEIVLDGVLVGLGALFVPTHIFAIPALLIFYAASEQNRTICHKKHDEAQRKDSSITCRRIRFLSQSAFALFLGGLIAVSPWLVRNARVEKAFIPFTATSGQQFFTGFNEQAGMNTGTEIECSDAMIQDLRAARTGKEFERVHWKYALEWVRTNPAEAAQLWGLKAVNWFRWNNGTLNTESARIGGGADWLQRLSTLFTFFICVAGCIRWWPEDKRWILFGTVLMLANAFGHAFFISRYRYRLPFEPVLLMLGFCGLFFSFNFSHRGKEENEGFRVSNSTSSFFNLNPLRFLRYLCVEKSDSIFTQRQGRKQRVSCLEQHEQLF